MHTELVVVVVVVVVTSAHENPTVDHVPLGKHVMLLGPEGL